MRGLGRFVAVGAVTAGSVMGGVGAAHAETRTCTGRIEGSTKDDPSKKVELADVVVPAGANCVLSGVEVSGSVTVNGRLVAQGTQITGGVTQSGSRSFTRLENSTVTGDVRWDKDAEGVDVLNSPVAGTVGPAQDRQGSYTTIRIKGSVVGGDALLRSTSMSAGIFDSEVKGSAEVQSDSAEIYGTRIASDLNVDGRFGAGLVGSTVQGAVKLSTAKAAAVVRDSQVGSLDAYGFDGTQIFSTTVHGLATSRAGTHRYLKSAGANNHWGSLAGELATCFPDGVGTSIENESCTAADPGAPQNPGSGLAKTLDTSAAGTIEAAGAAG